MTDNLRSALAPEIAAFIQEKRSCGCRYVAEEALLNRLDRSLCSDTARDRTLSREQVERFITKQPHERPRTHKARVLLVRQFALFLRRREIGAHVPDSRLTGIVRMDFVPHIFTRHQMRQFLEAVDRLRPDSRSPERQLVMAEMFRLLYGCGLRVGEALRLRIADVDLERGVLTIREGKFRKDRLVPMAASLAERLRRYVKAMNLGSTESILLPNPLGQSYDKRTIYLYFRRALRECGIPHGGRGRGPRLHDLRHTFAVHCLQRWYRQGEDLNARLPLLVAYLGHQSLAGTQRYLRLTPAVFPDITARLESFLQQSTRS